MQWERSRHASHLDFHFYLSLNLGGNLPPSLSANAIVKTMMDTPEYFRRAFEVSRVNRKSVHAVPFRAPMEQNQTSPARSFHQTSGAVLFQQSSRKDGYPVSSRTGDAVKLQNPGKAKSKDSGVSARDTSLRDTAPL